MRVPIVITEQVNNWVKKEAIEASALVIVKLPGIDAVEYNQDLEATVEASIGRPNKEIHRFVEQ